MNQFDIKDDEAKPAVDQRITADERMAFAALVMEESKAAGLPEHVRGALIATAIDLAEPKEGK